MIDLLLLVAIGLLIGAALGALGGGGSILTVPALVYLLGEPPAAATTAALIIVGITATTSAVSRSGAGAIRWRQGLAFGTSGAAASLLGSRLSTAADPDLLLVAVAALMLAAAAALVRPSRKADRTAAVTSVTSKVVRVVAAGSVVGFLTGFLGVGGGFVIVPALVFALGYDMPDAIGTSLLVIAMNAAVALAARAGQGDLHWAVIIPFTLTAVIGAHLGHRIAASIGVRTLTRAFAVLLVLVAGYTAARSLPALVT